MSTLLDVSSLPRQLVWSPDTTAQVNLGGTVHSLRNTIDEMMRAGVIDTRESFGFALATPDIDLTEVWDDPTKLIGLVVGWGPDADRYIANACRKIRPAAREGMDSEFLRMARKEQFCDVVESVEDDGSFAWGDFPYDGAAYTGVQGRVLLGAVSAFPKEQDPIVARLITGFIGHAMFKSDLLAPAS